MVYFSVVFFIYSYIYIYISEIFFFFIFFAGYDYSAVHFFELCRNVDSNAEYLWSQLE